MESGVTGAIQEKMVAIAGGNDWTLALFLVWFGGAISSIVDNIPYTATMAQVVKEITVDTPKDTVNPLWWALTLGADLGGNATIVGASAIVIVVTMARAAGYPIGILQFFKYGVVVGAVTLVISSLFLWVRFYLPV